MNRIFSLNEEQWNQLLDKHKQNTWLPKLRRLAQHLQSDQDYNGAMELGQEDPLSSVESP